MLPDQLRVVAIAAVVLLGLELWRRALRNRAPHWVHVVAGLLSIEIMIGVIVSVYKTAHAFDDLRTEEAGNKASILAHDISDALRGDAIAFVGVILAVIVLTIGTILGRPVTTARVRRSGDRPR